MKRTKQDMVSRHISSNPSVQGMAGDALFDERPNYKLNKKLLKQYGLTRTLFLAHIYDKWKYCKIDGQLQADGSFFLRHQDIQEATGLTEYAIKKCKKELIEMGWISTKMKGMPQKEYYYLHLEVLAEMYLGCSANCKEGV